MFSLYLVLVYVNINNVYYFFCISIYFLFIVVDDRDLWIMIFYYEVGCVILVLFCFLICFFYILIYLISLIDG